MSSTTNPSHTDSSAGPRTHRPELAIDHSGMSLTTHFYPEMTIVEAQGAIDACNAARLHDHIENVASPSRPVILDLRGVDFFGGAGFRALVRIDNKCQLTGVRWALVTSEAIDRLLHSANNDRRLPAVASVQEALQRLTAQYSDRDASTIDQRLGIGECSANERQHALMALQL